MERTVKMMRQQMCRPMDPNKETFKITAGPILHPSVCFRLARKFDAVRWLRGTAATALSRPFHAGVWTALSIIVQEEASNLKGFDRFGVAILHGVSKFNSVTGGRMG